MLQTLTNLMSSNVKFKWTGIGEKVLEDIMRIVAHDNLLTYTYLNKQSGIHTNTKNFQLG